MRKTEPGFTLIELLAVVLILGIVSAIAVFAVSGVAKGAAVRSCKIDWQSVVAAKQAYINDNTTPAGSVNPDTLMTLVNGKYLASNTVESSLQLPGWSSAFGGGIITGSGRYEIVMSGGDVHILGYGTNPSTLSGLTKANDSADLCDTAVS